MTEPLPRRFPTIRLTRAKFTKSDRKLSRKGL